MIESLANCLNNFPGAANQTCCFLHLLNLTAKSVLRQFKVPKKKLREDRQDDDNDNDNDFTKVTEALQALSVEIEDDGPSDDVASDEDDKEDNNEGLEERQGMMAEEIAELEEELLPARRMLTKVCTYTWEFIFIIYFVRFEPLRTRSRTHRPLFSHNGTQS
jgi:hypothetical protein